MIPRQRIVRERRQYNQWVASQTLEDYALRYTAGRARKSAFTVGNTALGPVAFLACEAIGGTITIAYGFPNAVWAIAAFTVLMFLIGLPIAYYAARYGIADLPGAGVALRVLLRAPRRQHAGQPGELHDRARQLPVRLSVRGRNVRREGDRGERHLARSVRDVHR